MGLTSSKTGMMTQTELELVNKSWKVVMERPEENGILIFKAFLDKYHYYSKFEKFRGIHKDELPNSQVFRQHSAAIIEAINKIILDFGDPVSLKNQLLDLGTFHGKKKVKEKQFQELKGIILDKLQHHFHLPQETVSAWTKLLDFGFEYVFEGLHK